MMQICQQIISSVPHLQQRRRRAVMKGLDIVIGGLIVIRHEIADPEEDEASIGTAIGIAWPTNSLELNVVQLHAMLRQSHLIYEGDRVRLSKHNGQIKTAREVSVCCIDEQKPHTSEDHVWIGALKDLLLEIRYMTEGMDFECAHHGKMHAFTLTSLTGTPSRAGTNQSESILRKDRSNEELIKSLDALAMSSGEPLLPRFQGYQARNSKTTQADSVKDDEKSQLEEDVPDLFVFEEHTAVLIDHRPQSSGQILGRSSPRMSQRFEHTPISSSPLNAKRPTSPGKAHTLNKGEKTNGPSPARQSQPYTPRSTNNKKTDHVNERTEASPKTAGQSRFVEIDTDEESEIAKASKLPRISYSSIGGLSSQITSLREIVELPLLRPHVFARFNMSPPRGVLLFGPPGTGKTMLLRAVASETSAKVFTISGPSIISKYMGEAEEKLRKLWKEAEAAGPSIIFIDEVDAITPKREADAGEAESRLVASLLTLMDGMDAESKVVVIGATNRPNAIDPALRRPGRFDREIEIGIPDAKSRLQILQIMLENIPHTLSSEFIENVASKTHGFVGADLSAVCRESVLITIKTGLKDGIGEEQLIVEEEHMSAALHLVRPSAMREIFLEPPKTRWSDIGGQEHVKQKLKESVEWPLTHPDTFRRLGIVPAKGVLLYGPPGCSKTLTAKALATEAGLNFMAVKGPELYNKYVGEAERALREVFRKARAASPSIIFFDEIDALSGSRSGDGEGSSDRILTTLLNEIDGVENLVNVTILAATNRPDVIDPALLRPGRLDRLLYVGPPDLSSRLKILQIQFSRMAISKDVTISALAGATEGCSGAEIAAFCRDAGLLAMQDDLDAQEIQAHHFDLALSRLKRGITPEMIDFYETFAANYGDSV
ncbi:Ribosome biogenesis factor recycling AAA family ATPase [Taphrina deformans PYCC 5710]|uniref:Ribosome biogenesis factor recycling AAA family ATPase n=1 Tax=Taphrina deformans (strain PYCC 5710 / ATCC 11124 / CBS 356.35 / IMI 108563 / JCM 9778 / NBRC 8474) TaxID=1097556 RepID=R4X6T7_TAPDE|nr:Ribosome biogenesis factor recycling AAA family ATPase [Taphrina deformans PYCC 5710]|eukprot:CCG80922.1 Ribosome biogenesis factor recycling AAA family ATPase [Taphrina deformans PYCC 5710]